MGRGGKGLILSVRGGKSWGRTDRVSGRGAPFPFYSALSFFLVLPSSPSIFSFVVRLDHPRQLGTTEQHRHRRVGGELTRRVTTRHFKNP